MLRRDVFVSGDESGLSLSDLVVTCASAAPSVTGPMVAGCPALITMLEVHARSPGEVSCTRRMPESISTCAGVTPAGLPSTSICAPEGTELTVTTPKFGLSATFRSCFSPMPVMVLRTT